MVILIQNSCSDELFVEDNNFEKNGIILVPFIIIDIYIWLHYEISAHVHGKLIIFTQI